MLRRRGDFHSMGEHCSVNPHAVIDSRKLVRIGNNVWLSSVGIFPSDGSVNMINRAYGLRLDKVGSVDIRDNVYVGHGVLITPGTRGVTIGPNAIVAAGSVVRSDVAEGDVVAGVPARPVARLADVVERLQRTNEQWPWRHLIEQRATGYDRALEPELMRLRAEYFFGPAAGGRSVPAGASPEGERPPTPPR
jgi:UDP-3-O-[3-hydroxymyristoyl] glucosamine N-acyltransferase